jgi:hypothetical protein
MTKQDDLHNMEIIFHLEVCSHTDGKADRASNLSKFVECNMTFLFSKAIV